MKTIIVLALLFIFEGSAAAADPAEWTVLDTGLQIAGLALLEYDRRQTLDSDGYYVEHNKALGEQPSHRKINQYFLMSALVSTGGAIILGKPWRTVWQSGWIGVELYAVYGNYRAEIRVSW